MPITLEEVNALTDEQITPEIEAALLPKLAARATAYLTSNGHVVKKKADYDTEFNAAVAAKNKEAIDEEGARLYGSIDNILKLLGMPKPEGTTRTREWVLKLAADGKLPLTNDQMEAMKKKLEAKGATESQADNAVEDLKKEIDKLKNGDPEKEKENLQKTARRAADQSLKAANVKIDPSLTKDEDKTAAKNAAISDIRTLFHGYYEGAEDADGNLGYVKKGTKDILTNTATGEPMTALEIIQKNHSMFLAPTGHQQKGVGTNSSGAAGGSGSGATRTLKDIFVEASEKGLATNTPDWKKFVNEEKKKAGIK